MRVVPVLFALAIAASTLLMGANALAERPVAAKLLPDQTMIYLQARSMPDLIKAFRETSMGRITNDPKIKPLVAHLYGSVLDAYTQIEERIGLPMADLLSLPQGEICIALVVQEQGNPEVVLMLDVGKQSSAAETLLKRLDDVLLGAGASRAVENVGDVQVDSYQLAGRQRRLVVFEKDETVVVSSNIELSKLFLDVCGGNEELVTHSVHKQFTTIMQRFGGDNDE